MRGGRTSLSSDGRLTMRKLLLCLVVPILVIAAVFVGHMIVFDFRGNMKVGNFRLWLWLDLTLILSSAVVGFWLRHIATNRPQAIVGLVGPLAYLGWWVMTLHSLDGLFGISMPVTEYAEGSASLVGTVVGYVGSALTRRSDGRPSNHRWNEP